MELAKVKTEHLLDELARRSGSRIGHFSTPDLVDELAMRPDVDLTIVDEDSYARMTVQGPAIILTIVNF